MAKTSADFAFVSTFPLIHYTTRTFSNSIQAAMASSEETILQVFQTFRSQDDKPLTSLPTRVCSETGQRYVLWKDIQDTFRGVDHLKYWSGYRIIFMSDGDGELYDTLSRFKLQIASRHSTDIHFLT